MLRLYSCLGAACGFSALLLAQTQVEVSAPTVTGPIAWTSKAPDPSHGYTFNPTFLDLAAKGYVEEEFFIEGEATRYDMARAAAPGSAWAVVPATAIVLDSGHRYKTRIVVRRPI